VISSVGNLVSDTKLQLPGVVLF